VYEIAESNMNNPQVSVIVPGYNASNTIEQCLSSICAQEYPVDCFEIIYVDDASTDESAKLASRWTQNIIRLSGSPRGPAAARNAGVAQATGQIIVFLDADIVAPSGTIKDLVERLENDAKLDAVFGSYDSEPFAKDLVSQYRNLLHHLVHQTSRREAITFWAGCGAIRKRSFELAGGFNAARYPGPMIEDIELGHRMTILGMRIMLDRSITVKHLKRWTLFQMIRSDIFCRGIPWMRLLLQEGQASREIGNLNLRLSAFLSIPLAWIGITIGILSLWYPRLFLTAFLTLFLGFAINIPIYLFFLKIRGFYFALISAPLHFVYHLCNGISVIMALLYRFLIDHPLPGLKSLGLRMKTGYWRNGAKRNTKQILLRMAKK
jgi:glycosyltransferase involved in cell wall biosynthesis